MNKRDDIYDFYNYDFMEQKIGAPSDNYLYDYYLKIAKLKNVSDILELGYGTGFLTKILLENNFKVTAIDKSSDAKLYLQKKCIHDNLYNNIIIKDIDILDYKTGRKFDLILAADEFIKHFLTITELDKFFKKANSILNENGVLVTDIRINHDDEFNKINNYPIFTYANPRDGIKNISCSSWKTITINNIVLVHFKYDEISITGNVQNSYIKILKQGRFTVEEMKAIALNNNLSLSTNTIAHPNYCFLLFTKIS